MIGAAPTAIAAPVKSKKIAAPIEKIKANLIRWPIEFVLPDVSMASRDRSVTNNGKEQGENREANPAVAARANKPIPIAEGSGACR
jgi:hypothetical protein